MSKLKEFEVVEPTLVGFKSSSEDDFHWLPEINRSPKKYKINVMFMTASSSMNHENRSSPLTPLQQRGAGVFETYFLGNSTLLFPNLFGVRTFRGAANQTKMADNRLTEPARRKAH